ncbi:unnamed protein product, partial [Ilex paraguariensis]
MKKLLSCSLLSGLVLPLLNGRGLPLPSGRLALFEWQACFTESGMSKRSEWQALPSDAKLLIELPSGE